MKKPSWESWVDFWYSWKGITLLGIFTAIMVYVRFWIMGPPYYF